MAYRPWRLTGVSSAAGGGGAQVVASGTAWNETGAVLRARQDAVSVVDGGDCGQPDAGGWQSRDDGRSSNRLSVLQHLSPLYPHIHDLAVRHSYRPERIADTDNLSLAVTIALRSTGFSSALLGRPLALWTRPPRRPAGPQPAELARCATSAPAGSGSSCPPSASASEGPAFPTRVSHARYPLRWVRRAGLRSPYSAPILADTSASMISSTRTRRASLKKLCRGPMSAFWPHLVQ